MIDPGVAEALIAYTALITTVVAGILAFLLKEYFPVKSRVNRIYRDLYGDESGQGLLDDVDEEHDSLNDRLSRIDNDHEDLSEDVKEVRYYVRRICEELEEETDADLPEVREHGRWQNDDD